MTDRTVPYTDYITSTVYLGEMPGSHEERELIRIEVNEYGEQYIVREKLDKPPKPDFRLIRED